MLCTEFECRTENGTQPDITACLTLLVNIDWYESFRLAMS
jgi:hypothetical protein